MNDFLILAGSRGLVQKINSSDICRFLYRRDVPADTAHRSLLPKAGAAFSKS
jgi:hypothetical protein